LQEYLKGEMIRRAKRFWHIFCVAESPADLFYSPLFPFFPGNMRALSIAAATSPSRGMMWTRAFLTIMPRLCLLSIGEDQCRQFLHREALQFSKQAQAMASATPVQNDRVDRVLRVQPVQGNFPSMQASDQTNIIFDQHSRSFSFAVAHIK
jgi:hypothetical protein